MSWWKFWPVLLVCCADPPAPSSRTVDQCLRRELFKECLSTVPRGPTSVGSYNDWDEVIAQCRDQAYYTAMRQWDQVKPECRP